MPERILNRLKIVAAEAGSQQKLADICEVNQSYISRVLKGEKEVTLSIITHICTKLKYNPQWLLLGVGERKVGKNTVNLVTEVAAFRVDVEIANTRIDVLTKKIAKMEQTIESLKLSSKTV